MDENQKTQAQLTGIEIRSDYEKKELPLTAFFNFEIVFPDSTRRTTFLEALPLDSLDVPVQKLIEQGCHLLQVRISKLPEQFEIDLSQFS